MFKLKTKYDYKIPILVILTIITSAIYFYILYQNNLKEKLYIKEQSLNNYAKTIEVITVNELKRIFTETDSDFIFIDNHKHCKPTKQDMIITYSSLQLTNNNQCTIIDLSKIRNVLNQISGTEYIYTIMLNDVPLISNSNDKDLKSYNRKVALNESYKVILLLDFDSKSIFKIDLAKQIQQSIKSSSLYSATIISIIICIILLYFKEKGRANKALISKEQTKKYISKQNNFILECYKFTQSKSSEECNNEKEYFPLPIIHGINESITSIILSETLKEIEGYFESYMAHKGENKIKIFFQSKKDESMSIPFAKEVLNQILISIIFNLLNFSEKSEDKKTIKINFADSVFSLESNGFQLNKEVVIMASQRIFYDSCNPFILNFSQIIGILTKYKIKIDIVSNTNSKILLDFKKKKRSKNTSDAEIIHLQSYKKEST